jgi:hypothetical protein
MAVNHFFTPASASSTAKCEVNEEDQLRKLPVFAACPHLIAQWQDMAHQASAASL